MAHSLTILPLLALAACGGELDVGVSASEREAPVEPIVEPTGPPAHADDPPGWIPIDEFEGLPVEVVRHMHPNGALRRIVSYHAGRTGDPDARHGPEWSMFPAGFKKEELIFRDGVLQGSFMRAYKNGQLRKRGVYVDGQRDGLYEQWFENGDLQLQFTFDEGTPTGTCREWYVAMAPKLEETFVDGLKSGERRLWDKPAADENGDLPDEGHLTLVEQYVDGQRHGPWQDFDPFSGTARTAGTFERGVPVGTWTLRYRDGTLLDEYAFADGQMHGQQHKFTTEGSPLEELTWVGGSKTGPARSFYADGTVKAEGSYLDGQRQGTWTYYSPDGDINPTWSGLYENDEKVGDLSDDS